MKKFKKIILYVLIAIIVIVVGMLSYVKFMLPNVGKPENIKVELTPERIERGKYLANCVCACVDCHSTRDWNKYAGPLVDGSIGKGGEEFTKKYGFPGDFYAPNITPFALKEWTDGELLRAITCGVDKEGKALFPVMPYLNYGKIDKEDLYSIIAYLRTLKPVENNVPDSKANFPMSLIMHMIPKKATYTTIPDKNDKIAYGKYIYNSASCNDCHTRQVKGKPVAGMELAGGFEFKMVSGGSSFSANITPDEETGIGNWTEEVFVKRFKAFSDSIYKPAAVNKGEFNTIMPWSMYSNLKDEDLKALYAYLRTVKPVKNTVIRFKP